MMWPACCIPSRCIAQACQSHMCTSKCLSSSSHGLPHALLLRPVDCRQTRPLLLQVPPPEEVHFEEPPLSIWQKALPLALIFFCASFNLTILQVQLSLPAPPAQGCLLPSTRLRQSATPAYKRILHGPTHLEAYVHPLCLPVWWRRSCSTHSRQTHLPVPSSIEVRGCFGQLTMPANWQIMCLASIDVRMCLHLHSLHAPAQ